MIDVIKEIFKIEVVYTCTPVVLFGFGYWIKERWNNKKERQDLLFDLIHANNVVKASKQEISYKQMEFLRNSLNNIHKLFPMNINNISHTKNLLNVLNNGPTPEIISTTLNLLIIELSKTSWRFYERNKFKTFDDISKTFTYYPTKMYNTEINIDSCISGQILMYGKLARDDKFDSLSQEKQTRITEILFKEDS